MVCSQCGVCCKLFARNLSKEEYLSGKYDTQFKEFDLGEDFTHVHENGGNILSQNNDGSCIYKKGKLCSIHQTRPQVCRDFCCDSTAKKFKGMVRLINLERLTGGV